MLDVTAGLKAIASGRLEEIGETGPSRLRSEAPVEAVFGVSQVVPA
jgi:hypothetical protein